jgi:TetR/AcrR family transcriptional regulator
MEEVRANAKGAWGFSDTISRILDVALQEFGTKGFASTSTNEIAKKAGVSKQLLYHYFDGKRDLYALVLSYLAEELYTAQLAVDFEGLTALEAIKQSFLVIYDIFESNELAVTITIDQALHRGAHIRKDARAKKLRAELMRRLSVAVQKGQQAGEVSDRVDAVSIHIMATLLVVGRFSLWPMLKFYMGSHELVDDGASKETMAEFYMRAIRP